MTVNLQTRTVADYTSGSLYLESPEATNYTPLTITLKMKAGDTRKGIKAGAVLEQYTVSNAPTPDYVGRFGLYNNGILTGTGIMCIHEDIATSDQLFDDMNNPVECVSTGLFQNGKKTILRYSSLHNGDITVGAEGLIDATATTQLQGTANISADSFLL